MKRKTKLILGGSVALCAAAAISVDFLLVDSGRSQWTNDAYITADFSVVAPKVGGLVDRVAVEDNERVRAGQEVAHIEDSDYIVAVEDAEAALVAAQAKVDNLTASIARHEPVIGQQEATVRADTAALRFARANAVRYHNLSAGGAGTVEQQQQSTSQLEQASANRDRAVSAVAAVKHEIPILEAQRREAVASVKRAEATLRQARLNLRYTHILAPIDGIVGQRSVRVGNFVTPGTSLLAVVPLEKAYVIANFQETQLTHVARGQHAQIAVDTFPGQPLRGTVDSLAPASGIAFSPIPPDNATGNFTKVVQRIPLKIRLDPGQPLVRQLRVGMSVDVDLDTGSPGTPQATHGGTGR